MTEYCHPNEPDHVTQTQAAFPDYSMVWGSGFSWPGVDENPVQRQEFGNLSLIKSTLLDYRIHQLPSPATPGKVQMQRVAVEAVVNTSIGSVSIINTHLAFHDSSETQQQLERLYHLELERTEHHRQPKLIGIGTYQQGYPAAARMLCGDFNFLPNSSHYRYQTEKYWIDAWHHTHRRRAHLPTCGIFDFKQWPEGGHCRDYFWLSQELQGQKIRVDVDTATSLSDHQPVTLEISI